MFHSLIIDLPRAPGIETSDLDYIIVDDKLGVITGHMAPSEINEAIRRLVDLGVDPDAFWAGTHVPFPKLEPAKEWSPRPWMRLTRDTEGKLLVSPTDQRAPA